jgi:hypothetical protein
MRMLEMPKMLSVAGMDIILMEIASGWKSPMADAGLHLQSIGTASIALVVGEEAGVPQIAVVAQEVFLGARNIE